MRLIGVISTAVLSLIIAVPAYYATGAARPAGGTESQACPGREKGATGKIRKAGREKRAAAGNQHQARREECAAGARIANRKRKMHSRTTKLNRKKETRRSYIRNRPSLSCRRSVPVAMVAAFPMTVSRPILDRNTGFVSARPITIIAASNTAAIRSDSSARGRATGSTPRTFLWSTINGVVLPVQRELSRRQH